MNLGETIAQGLIHPLLDQREIWARGLRKEMVERTFRVVGEELFTSWRGSFSIFYQPVQLYWNVCAGCQGYV